jgi:site-specific recombinase XerC
MKVPQVPEKAVWVLSREEITSLLGVCRSTGFEVRRDLAILRMFVTTGAGRLEIANLRLDPDNPLENDVDLGSGVVRVLSKGGRDRLVPLDPLTMKGKRSIDISKLALGIHTQTCTGCGSEKKSRLRSSLVPTVWRSPKVTGRYP